MKVLPILFNTDMVNAILEGDKTSTRRIAKKIPKETYRIEEILGNGMKQFECHWGGYMPDVSGFADGSCIVIPPYHLGDILYVRETWSEWTGGYVYKAWRSPFQQPGRGREEYMKWKPSIHMPKEAARIWLEVKDIRAERLKDITVDEIQREGLLSMGHSENIEEEFSVLWNTIVRKSDIGLYGWDANPWVWVIEFERCENPEVDREMISGHLF